ncbi:cysteine desulfurase-like protein [Litchfieldia alkalitelluris]|uniref:cysteine desulfurase-like protein n=1 Tax=Litchfieldia alkalitelluris TaxID=304268 RepID=UPI0009981986|nr:cysteine desulfurase-like protein [Litchfieldia alkalitelluris]
MTFSVGNIRSQFPALTRTYNGKQAIYFDGPGGSQVVQAVIDQMVAYMEKGGANLHGQFPSSIETESDIANARQAIADLVGAKPEEVAFGANSTTLAFAISRSVSRKWNEQDNIVLTEIDHRANVDTWLTAAEDKGTEIRFIPVNTDSYTLELDKIDELITSSTKLVAVTLASNAVGTITDVERISKRAREVGALFIVDAVHAVPHFLVDRDKLGANILLCSSYKFFGPHVGMAIIKQETFDELSSYKLKPAPGNFPDKLETGTQNHEALAAIPAAVDFIASVGTGNNRREQLINAYHMIEEYENGLAIIMRNELSAISSVTLYQAGQGVPKTPTIAFTIDGISPSEACKWFAENYSIFVADGNFYASTLADKLGINETGGWIRAGLAPYNTEEEVMVFIKAVKELVELHK